MRTSLFLFTWTLAAQVTLPLHTPNPQPPPITRIVGVAPPMDFQAALSSVTPGTNLVCSGVFIGNFIFPDVSGVELSGTCTLQSPNTMPALANISATNGAGWRGVITDRAVSDWWITGITIASSGPIFHAVMISNDCDPTPAGMPSGITFSDVTVNGIPMADGQQNGLYLDGANISVLNSSVQHWQSAGLLNVEAQGIEVICGTGPYLFRGNTISGISQGIFFAAPGASPTVAASQITPADISILGNTVTKDLSWIGSKYQAYSKNCMELKNAQRVMIAGNTINNCFPGAQTGEGILLTPRMGLGIPSQMFSQVSDVDIVANQIQAGVGISVSGLDSFCTQSMPCVYSSRVSIVENSLNVSRTPNGIAGSYGWCGQLDGAHGLNWAGNTCTTDGTQSIFINSWPCVGCSFSNSTFNADFGAQGIVGPSGLFNGAWCVGTCGNSINTLTFTGISPAAFQSEWVSVCSKCVLK